MKALYFAKPLEYRLETPAEALTQGERFSGEFHATNRGDLPSDARSFSVALAYADFRAVRDKPARAFDIRDRCELGSGISLQPGETFRGEWSFALPTDCPITSKTGALFLLYGSTPDEPGRFGMLDLNVALAPVLETFISTVENLFSFQATGRKHHDGYTEVRFKVPATYPSLEKLQILMRYREPEGMQLVYQAKVKGFDREGKSGLQSRPLNVERVLPPEQAFTGARLPNRNLFREAFQEALGTFVPLGMRR